MSALTRNAIRQTFWKLLEQMPLEKITVKMIVDQCGISRNTFYYHYEDIRALLRDSLASALRRTMAETPDAGRWQTQILQLLSAVAANRRVFDHIYHSADREALQAYLRREATALSLSAVDAAGGQDLDPKLRETIAAFYAGAFICVCLQWLDSSEPPEELLGRLALFDGQLEETVAKAKKFGH